MNYPPPTGNANDEQPVEFIDECGGLYFRAIVLAAVGDFVPQHSHDYQHVTLVCAGSARVWVDGKWLRDAEAFSPILIEANKEHIFQALAPNTRLACVHQLNGKAYGV